MKTKLAIHAALEILALEAYVELDNSYKEEIDPERKSEGKSDDVRGRM